MSWRSEFSFHLYNKELEKSVLCPLINSEELVEIEVKTSSPLIYVAEKAWREENNYPVKGARREANTYTSVYAAEETWRETSTSNFCWMVSQNSGYNVSYSNHRQSLGLNYINNGKKKVSKLIVYIEHKLYIFSLNYTNYTFSP